MSEHIFVAVDANLIGKKIEKFILDDELEKLSVFSIRLSETVSMIEQSILSIKGHVYMAAGDNVLAMISQEYFEKLLAFWEDLIPTQLFTFSVGVGDTPAEAYLAIKYAKVNGCFAVLYRNNRFEIV